jgi:4-hydroxybenzoate polyprenyltransferase
MGTTITKYLRLGRITSWPAFSLAFLVPFAVGAYEGTNWTGAILGFVALILLASFSFALNFYSDRDTDRYHDGKQKDMNLAQQPMLTGEVTERECKVFCVVALLLMTALAFLAGNLFGLLALSACLLGGVLYSHPYIRLKAKPVLDIACMCCFCTLLFSAGYALARETMLGWQVLVYFFLLCAIVYIPSVVQDYDADVRAGLRSSAVVFGKLNLTRAMWAVCLCMIPVAWLIASGPYAVAFKVCAVLALANSVAYTVVSLRSLSTPRYTMPLIDRFPRATMISSAILAVLCVCYALSKAFIASYLP